MSARRPTSHVRLGMFLIVALVVNGFIGLNPTVVTVNAQDRIIVINADQPNVWTLEQAHYLLAQMHRRNLDLRTKNLEELDPNEIAGLRFDVLRSLVELGVSFDDANRVSNRMLQRNMNFNTARREELITRRQRLRDESLALTREIANLQTAKAAATTEETGNRIDAEIAAKTALRAEVDKEVGFLDQELGTLSAPSGEFQRTEAGGEFDPEKLPKSVFDDAFKKAAETQIEKFNQQPRLNASLRLENFLQMQYEIIAKQLTLLRDEVGPGERLLFLELPQTVNVTHHEGNNKWAQSWWRIVGYTRNVDLYANDLPNEIGDNYRMEMRGLTRPSPSPSPTQSPRSGATESGAQVSNETSINQETQQQLEKTKRRIERNSAPQPTSQKITQLLRVLKAADSGKRVSPEQDGVQFVNFESGEQAEVRMLRGSQTVAVPLSERTARAVELIPRQSSLNVNDMKLRVRSGALTAVASLLIGFGTRLNVQRQREQFSQFVQQELYSSAFGKGSREFGWTFTPMPGTDRLQSGQRTTYAVVVVPEEATSLVLESNGCYFPRSAYQPNDFNDTLNSGRWGVDNRTSRNCGSSKAFLVPVPVGGTGKNDFRVDGVTYRPVERGERIVVSVYGYNFSAQTGVLVAGSPLTQSIGLAQPLIRDDSLTGARTVDDLKNERVKGRIERLDSEQIVFSFEMPSNFTGTPTITLVAPGKAIDINRLPLYINGANTTLDAIPAANRMFRPDPAAPTVKIDGIEAFRSSDGQSVRVVVSGKGFTSPQTVFVNGIRVADAFVSSTLLHAVIPATPDETVQLVFSSGIGTIKSKAIPNPAHLRINNATIVSYEPATRRSPVAVLVVKLEGAGFSEWVQASHGTLTLVSPTEAMLRIEDPTAATPLVLTDQSTGFTARIVITWSRPRRAESP